MYVCSMCVYYYTVYMCVCMCVYVRMCMRAHKKKNKKILKNIAFLLDRIGIVCYNTCVK